MLNAAELERKAARLRRKALNKRRYLRQFARRRAEAKA